LNKVLHNSGTGIFMAVWVSPPVQSSDCRRPSLIHISSLYHTIDDSDSEQPAEEPAAKIRYSQFKRVQW